MVLPRPSGPCTNLLFRRPIRPFRGHSRQRSWQRSQRRTYSSSGEGPQHATHKSSGDLPWAIGSLAVFIPSAWYLAQPQLNKKPHGEGHDEHKSHEGEEGESHEDEKSGEQHEQEDKDSEDHDGEDEGEEGKESEGGETAPEDGNGEKDSVSVGDEDKDNTEGKPNRTEGHIKGQGNSSGVEGVQFKGATNAGKNGTGDDKNAQSHTEKHVPDAKGYNKKRLESHYGKNLAPAEDEDQSADDKDLGAASKQPGGVNTQSGKQEGLSNTNTKHSTDISNDPDKSKKSDGMPETAKQKGTVDPTRPTRGPS